MEINSQNFHIVYNPEFNMLSCQGSIRLSERSPEYQSIADLFNMIAEQHPKRITLYINQLYDLNDTTLQILIRFLVRLKNVGESRLILYINDSIDWQTKISQNFKYLMPSMVLEKV